MVAEDYSKINKIKSTATTSSSSAFSSSRTKQNNAENVFKAFQKFAAQKGLTIKAEDFQAIVNANPQIFDMPMEKQATAIAKYIIAEKETNTPAAVIQENSEETPTEETTEKASSKQFSFTRLTQEEKDQLAATIKEMLDAQQPEVQAVDEETIDTNEEIEAKKTTTQTAKVITTKAETAQTTDAITEKATETKATKSTVDNAKAKAEKVSDATQSLSAAIETTLEEETIPRLNNKTDENNEVSNTDLNKTKKVLYNEYIDQYAKNLYLYGKEKHTEEEWNNLTEEQKTQFIEKNNIINKIDKTLAKDNISNTNTEGKLRKRVILQSKLTTLEAANSIGKTLEEFEKLSEMEQTSVVADILETKDTSTLTTLEKSTHNTTLEKAKVLKAAIIHYFISTQNDIDKEKLTAIENMNYKELYTTLKKAGRENSIAIVLKEYLSQKDPKTFSDYEKLTYDIIKDLPAFALKEFGTEPGITKLEAEILNDEKYNASYIGYNSTRRAVYLRRHFEKTYGDNPEKFLEAFNDAVRHGNLIEIKALTSLLKKMPKSKAAMEAEQAKDRNITTLNHTMDFCEHADNECEVLLDSAKDALIANKITTEEANKASRSIVRESLCRNKIAQGLNKVDKNLKENILPKLNKLPTAIAAGTIEGIGDAAREGQVDKELIGRLGEIASECDEVLQDLAVEMAGDTTIDTELRGELAKPLFKNSGYAAIKAVEKHIAKTFSDNSEIQYEVFDSIKTGIENNCPKNQAIQNLYNLFDQAPELNEEIQDEAFETMMGSKYKEVKIYSASNIHTLAESAQAKALQIAYNTDDIEVIESATLQVDKMAKSAVEKMKNEIKAQILAMEERHSLSAIEELALRQLKKTLGFDIDTTTSEFKTKLQAYIEELKNLSRSEVYLKICNDIQSWPADKQAMILEAIAKYCPVLFSMMLDKYGTKLLVSFGQINSTTKNTILSQMLKTPSQRADAIAYMQANPNGNYSDNLKQLFNEIYDMLVESGAVVEKTGVSNSLRANNNKYQSVPSDLTSPNSIVNIGQKYNWNMTSDNDGNIGLIS